MKVVLIGATGFVGSKLLTELLNRGHAVTAIARHSERIPRNSNAMPTRADVLQIAELAKLLALDLTRLDGVLRQLQ